MKLTIIETGQVPLVIRDRFPDYPEMFRQMIAAVDTGISCETISIVQGETLPDPASIDAVLYTGSPAGVYDPEPWIAPLSDFIRAAAAAKTPQVGICFGHQIMGEALGGKVIKSPKGWGVGRHTYEVVQCPDVSGASCPQEVSIAVSHQDQVVELPPAADVIVRSAFTPYAGLSYRNFPAISFQCHPEFAPDYAAALYDARRSGSLGDEAADKAIASLGTGLDRLVLAGWIANFLRSAP
jgi:GMP synthase-like glutamine amidotransferase